MHVPSVCRPHRGLPYLQRHGSSSVVEHLACFVPHSSPRYSPQHRVYDICVASYVATQLELCCCDNSSARRSKVAHSALAKRMRGVLFTSRRMPTLLSSCCSRRVGPPCNNAYMNAKRMSSSKATLTKPSILVAPATVRISSDLAMGCSSIRHSAALRLLDHHLHTTGLLPRPSQSAGVDIYCAGQAVTTFPHGSVLLDELHDPANHFTAKSHMWVAKAGQGSSITFGGAITLNELVLATCSRVFVRIDLETGRSIKITEEERSSSFVVDNDWDGVTRFCHAIPTVNQLSTRISKDVASDRSLLGDEVLTVAVGPQHINHGDHVDHAFLAETAAHALSLGCSSEADLSVSSPSTLLIQYLAPGRLGQELCCHVKDNIASVWGDDGDGGMQLLVLAERCFEGDSPIPPRK